MKKIVVVIFSIFLFSPIAFAVEDQKTTAQQPSQPTSEPAAQATTQFATPVITPTTQPTPSGVKQASCIKIYDANSENLFYHALSSIIANHYEIKEIQTKNGYVLFSTANRNYLLSVSAVDKKQSSLKIMPENNDYHFSPLILTNIYDKVSANLSKPIKVLETLK